MLDINNTYFNGLGYSTMKLRAYDKVILWWLLLITIAATSFFAYRTYNLIKSGLVL